MRRRWQRACAVWVASVVLASCDVGPPVGRARAEMTVAERAAMDAYREDNLLTARRLAEAVIAEDPDSLVAHFVLGGVLRRAEGDLPGAMRAFDRARALYEGTWSVSPAPPDAPWRLHRELLNDIQELAQELEEHAYRLEIIEYHDALYQPDLHSQRAWTLLQLGRLDDARRSAAAARESADPVEQTLGYNAACAIAGRALDREQRREDCNGAFETARRRATLAATTDVTVSVNVAVHAYNAAHAAMGADAVESALTILDEGSRRLAFTPANPWRLRALIELGRGRANAAADALAEMDRWRRRQPPWMRDQDRAETDGVFALAMWIFGYPEAGRVAIDRAIRRPDRRGLVSTAAHAQAGRHLLVRRVLRRMEAVEARERAGFGGERSRTHTWSERLAQWQDDRRLLAILGEDELLVRTLMPWVEGGLGLPPWAAVEVLDVVGRGVGRVALDEVRRRDDAPAFASHHAALEAEWAWHAGRWTDVLAFARVAWDETPEEHALVRGRAAALAHRAAARLGRTDEARSWLNMALQVDPTIARRLDLEVPVIFVAQGPWGERVRDGLRASGRFRAAQDGWTLRIESDDDSIRGCFDLPRAGAPPCAEVMREEDESDDALLLRFASEFFREAFSLPLQGTTVNLRTLDGGTSFDSDAARENLRDSLERVLDARANGWKPPGTRKEGER